MVTTRNVFGIAVQGGNFHHIIMAARFPEMPVDLFRTKGIVVFSDLQEALGDASRATTFRYLKQMKYLRSYNHNGRFYTYRCGCSDFVICSARARRSVATVP